MDWLNRNRDRDTTVRVLSVEKSEADTVAVDTAVLLREPSSVFILDVPTVDCCDAFELDGEARVTVNNRPEMILRHTGNARQDDAGMWAAPGVLKTDWAVHVITKQADIARKTDKINDWSARKGTELIWYLEEAGVKFEHKESIADILSNAGSNPETRPEIQEQISMFFAELAGKTRALRNRVSVLKSEMHRGIRRPTETAEYQNPLLLGIVEPAETEPEKESEQEDAYHADQAYNNSTRKGAHSNERQITIDSDRIGGTRKVTDLPPPNAPNNTVQRGNATSQGEHMVESDLGELTQNDSPVIAQGTENGCGNTARNHAKLTLLPGCRDKLAPRILEAPTATLHFSCALSDVARHWRELANFEASVRARKLGIEMAVQERKLTLGSGLGVSVATTANEDPAMEYSGIPPQERNHWTLNKSRKSSQSFGEIKVKELTAEDPGQNKFYMATRKAGEAFLQPNNLEIVRIDSPMTTMSEPVPCVLEVPTRVARKQRQMPVEDAELIRENLITRGFLQRREETPPVDVQVDSEGQSQVTGKHNQTTSAKMAESSGSAASAGAHRNDHHHGRDTKAETFSKPEPDSIDGFWVHMDSEVQENGVTRGKLLAASSKFICMLTRDRDAAYNTGYDHIFRKIAFAPYSKREVIVGRLFNEYPCNLEAETPGKTQIFFASIIDRRGDIGKGFPYACGLFITSTNPASGEQPAAVLLQTSNPLYDEVVRAIEGRRDEEKRDMSQRLEVVDRPSLCLPNSEGPPLIEVEPDLAHLQAVTTKLEPQVRDRIRRTVIDRVYFMGQDVLAPPRIGPVPNTEANLTNEIIRQVIMVSERSQHETHCRDAMRANPEALEYLTELLPVEQARVYKLIATVMIAKHGIDSLHTYIEQANVNGVIAHLDHIIRHSMQRIPYGEPLHFPCVTEYEFQHNIQKLLGFEPWSWPKTRLEFAGLPYRPNIEHHMSRLTSNTRCLVDGDSRYSPHKLVYDRQPNDSQITPGFLLSDHTGRMTMEEVLAPLPWNLSLVPLDVMKEQASEPWRHEQWMAHPKVVVYNCVGLPEPRGHGDEDTGAHPNITRVVSYPVLQEYSGRHLIRPKPSRASINQPAFTTGSLELDRTFQTLIDKVAFPTVTSGANEQSAQQHQPEAPSVPSPADVEKDHVEDERGNVEMELGKEHGKRNSEVGVEERPQNVIEQSADMTKGHETPLVQESPAHRRPRASSLPSSFRRLSVRNLSPVIEQKDLEYRQQEHDDTPPAPILLAQTTAELEEGEISEMSELDDMRQLSTPFSEVSLEDTGVNIRAAPVQYDGLLEDDPMNDNGSRLNMNGMSVSPVLVPPRVLRNTEDRKRRAMLSVTPSNRRTRLPESGLNLVSTNFDNLRPPGLPARPVIQVNAVFAEPSIGALSPTPQRPPLPRPLKRKELTADDNRNQARGSITGDDMVLSTAVANVAGPSSHSSRMLTDQGSISGFYGGALDFWRQERSGRNLSSQHPSARRSGSFRPAEPSEETEKVIRNVESLTFVRPSRELEFADEKGSDIGDETSDEESRAVDRDQDGPESIQSSSNMATLGHSGTAEKSEQTKEREIRKGNEESSDSEGYYDTREYGTNDILSWRADLKLAEELVSQASIVSRSPVGSTGSSSPPPQTETDEMDTSSDDYIRQYREPINQTGERNFPRVPFNVDDPNSTVIIRGDHTMTEMHYLYHMYQRKAIFPDSVASPAAMEEAEFIHYPSATRDFMGYRDHSQSTIDETTNFRPEPNVQQQNPDRIPGPDHPLYSAHAVRRVLVINKSSLVNYPPAMTDFRLRIGREVAQSGATKQLGKDIVWICRIIAHGMSYTRPDVEDYCLVNADEDVCRWEHEKDEEEFLRIQEYGWRESTPSLEELPQIEVGAYQRAPLLNHSMLEFVVPIDADLAEATFNGNEQELMHLERAPDPLRRYRQLSTSATSIHGSPLAFWLSPLRQTRADLQVLFDLLVRLLRQKQFRDVVNRIPEEHQVKHYLRHHCVFFRIIDKGVPMAVQGFNTECEHQYPPSSQRDESSLRQYKPRNPLLLPEEDEFLFHSVQLMEHFGMFEASNAIRGIRGRHLLRPKDVRRLLRNGFLDSLDHFDHFGQRTWARERVEQS
ncbi:hypothetical protein C8J56DRAFT_888046 [Mycena floridula]|nr:hypothetical protein C8J56DRAFT_888046 [Mycena floridula]